MKFNISEQIDGMHKKKVLKESDQMTLQSVTEYLEKNSKLTEYVSWLVLAFKNDRIDLLKKMIDMFKKENLGGGSSESLDNQPLGIAPAIENEPVAEEEPPVEEVPVEEPAEEETEEEPPAEDEQQV